MKPILSIQQQLVPDLLDVMQKRYRLLQAVRIAGTAGRRTLAQSLDMTERVVRSEAEFLKERGLLDFSAAGMKMTETGMDVVRELEDMMLELKGIDSMAEKLRNRYNLSDVVILPGNCDESAFVKKAIGDACASRIKSHLNGKTIIAVTGGSTMAEVARTMKPDFAEGKQVLFVPARGGIGDDVRNEANTVAALMAQNTNGSHRVLYAPERISPDVRESLLQEPAIKEAVSMIQSADIVLHGVGDALAMAKRRKTPDTEFAILEEKEAVAEAFGYYFNKDGDVIQQLSTIGLKLDDLQRATVVIAAAGGASKGSAIRSYLNGSPKLDILVTDEAAARVLLEQS